MLTNSNRSLTVSAPTASIGLSAHDIQAVYNGLSESGLAPRNVRYTHTVLKAALKHAVHVRLMPANPCDHLSLPRRNHRESTVWTVEQAQAFLQATHDDPKLRVDHLLWYTLLHTGLRPGEAFGLQWENLEGNKLRIVRAVAEGKREGDYILKEPKTRRAIRTVVLTEEHAVLLAAYRDGQRPRDFIFKPCDPSRSRRKAIKTWPHDNRASARLRFSNALARVNRQRVKAELPTLPAIRLYDLRHTHATAMLRAGINPKLVADRLGHASIVITLDTYSHVLPDLQASAVEAYAAALASNGSSPPTPAALKERTA
ncbi:MAG TPA: site-specific integrase [Gemmatimonadales bacterium]|jgi:integrase|nr:site-specific integrase [Gemmatimonadales bacterium]